MGLFVVNRAPDLGDEFGREFLDVVCGFDVCGGLREDFLFCISVGFEGTSGDEVVAVQDFGHGSPLGLGAMVRGGGFRVNWDLVGDNGRRSKYNDMRAFLVSHISKSRCGAPAFVGESRTTKTKSMANFDGELEQIVRGLAHDELDCGGS